MSPMPPATRHQTATSTRFRKGQSGNPAGRPKVKLKHQGSAFDIIITRTLTITQGGKAREVTVVEALQHKTYQQAIAGNRMARREVLKMIAKREKALAARPKYHKPIKIVSEADPQNAYDALCILGIALPNPSWAEQAHKVRLLLAPWAVQTALAQRGLRTLSVDAVDHIKRCTANRDTLVWPKRLLP